MDRANADDLSSTARNLRPDTATFEFSDRFAGTEKLSRKIDTDDFVPLCERHLVDWRVLLESGVINQNVHRPELVANGLEHLGDILFVRNVGAISERRVAMAAQLIDHRLRLFFASDIINADASPGMTERERDGPANAGACTGDDGFLPLQQFPIFGLRQNRFRQI